LRAKDQPPVGDAMNTAARLQSSAEPGEILIDEPTFPLVQDAVVGVRCRRDEIDPRNDLAADRRDARRARDVYGASSQGTAQSGPGTTNTPPATGTRFATRRPFPPAARPAPTLERRRWPSSPTGTPGSSIPGVASRAACSPRPIPGRVASGVVAWPRSRCPGGVEQGASNHDRLPEGHGGSTPFASTSTFLQPSQISRSSKPIARAPDDREDPRRPILR
jgi:hypothetical protein